jgi:hypothetical protein
MGSPILTPQQQALGQALVSIDAAVDLLDTYSVTNANNMADPAPLENAITSLQQLEVQLTVQSIALGTAQQSDLDALKSVTSRLKSKLDDIDTDVARAQQVVAIGSALLAVAQSLIPAIDPAALAAALKQAGTALKSPAGGST